MIYFDEKYLTVRWDAAYRCVVMAWKSYATGPQFRTGLEKGLELVKKKAAKNWLADMRKMGVVSPENQKWSNEDWFPRAIAAGIKKMALVVPASTLAQMSVDSIMSKVEGASLETAYFDNIEDAQAWLK